MQIFILYTCNSVALALKYNPIPIRILRWSGVEVKVVVDWIIKRLVGYSGLKCVDCQNYFLIIPSDLSYNRATTGLVLLTANPKEKNRPAFLLTG